MRHVKLKQSENHILTEIGGIHVATVHVPLDCRPSEERWKECHRTAKLLATAPELLQIAELILEEWEKPTDGIQKGELIARLSQYADAARSAIKKAKE